ncbi:hypothetical protein ANN_17084 [Periplaneta americana]|uniref:Uncharacterized protein n=1 Tax=Periplaneta americana TaxID=6978 RepID=A0ABQ8STC6_PERAM|nr:hypothetical protein ANN_17084 [Periplaneta americana]
MAGLCEGGNEPADSLKDREDGLHPGEQNSVRNLEQQRPLKGNAFIFCFDVPSEFQSLGRAIVKEDEYEEVRWDEELKTKIREAAATVTDDMLKIVWEEFDYRLDICRVTRGSHIESL